MYTVAHPTSAAEKASAIEIPTILKHALENNNFRDVEDYLLNQAPTTGATPETQSRYVKLAIDYALEKYKSNPTPGSEQKLNNHCEVFILRMLRFSHNESLRSETLAKAEKASFIDLTHAIATGKKTKSKQEIEIDEFLETYTSTPEEDASADKLSLKTKIIQMLEAFKNQELFAKASKHATDNQHPLLADEIKRAQTQLNDKLANIFERQIAGKEFNNAAYHLSYTTPPDKRAEHLGMAVTKILEVFESPYAASLRGEYSIEAFALRDNCEYFIITMLSEIAKDAQLLSAIFNKVFEQEDFGFISRLLNKLATINIESFKQYAQEYLERAVDFNSKVAPPIKDRNCLNLIVDILVMHPGIALPQNICSAVEKTVLFVAIQDRPDNQKLLNLICDDTAQATGLGKFFRVARPSQFPILAAFGTKFGCDPSRGILRAVHEARREMTVA